MISPDPILDRARLVAEVDANPKFDVLIVGGGIAGAATFRELALQGLRCVLVERNDFASGASGALTRVAQGGFRYLEKGEFGLVARAVAERNRFVAAAPHQVRPLRVVLPTETMFGGAGTALARARGRAGGHSLPGAAVLRLAVAFYQWLGRRTEALPRGGLVFRRELQQRYPGIAHRYRAAAYEYEGLIAAPERVAIELVEDGVAASRRSAALNHAGISGFDGRDVVIHDRRSGALLRARPRVVVNAAGAGADRVARLFGIDARMVDGVAGTHLLIRAPAVARALGEDLLFFEDGDCDPDRRRLCCAYAVGDDVLLGATERPVADPDLSRPAADEDAYLLSALGWLFPDADVSAADVVGRLHGVRPLVASECGDVTGRSRDHAICVDRSPLLNVPLVTIAGGKWTTFRAIAEDTTRAVLSRLGRPRLAPTASLPIGGGRGWPEGAEEQARYRCSLANAFGLDAATAERLFATYGSRAPRVARWLARPGGRRIIAGTALTVGEVRFFSAEELAASADDIARRRTRLFLEGRAAPDVLAAIEHALSEPHAARRTEPRPVLAA